MHTYEHIGGCQGCDEIVARLSNVPVDDESQKYEDISCHRQYYADSQTNGDEYGLP